MRLNVALMKAFMDITPSCISFMAAAVFVVLILSLLWWIDTRRMGTCTPVPFSCLEQKYTVWEKWAGLALAGFAVLFTAVLWGVFALLSDRQVVHFGVAKFIIDQPDVSWGVPAFFLSMLLTVIPTHFLLRCLLGRKCFAEYTEYGNQKYGVNSWRRFRYIATVVIPLCLGFTALSIDWYAKVTQDGFVVNRFWRLGEEHYRFDQIRSIEHIKSFKSALGAKIRRPHFELQFDDGTRYNFRQAVNHLSTAEEQEIIQFLIAQSGQTVTVVDPYPRSEP
uniref:hypothetical protein n=1 Tax=Thaumasiovibrio occultus TaxID=1891184 RepID=UPI000B34CEE7|nr:hypothetical protein [Thaumasiovibrio occultus]